MTIRLRLTLVYSILLILVVTVFSLVLYLFQSRTALSIVERGLAFEYGRVTAARPQEHDGTRPPAPEDTRSSFTRPLLQIRNLHQTIIHQSDNLDELTLPLSETGLQAVSVGEVWLERVQLNDEWFLVRSQLNEEAGQEPVIVQTALPIGNEMEYLNELSRILLISDLSVILIALGLGWVFAGVALRPIQRITQTAQMVGEERDFGRRVAYAGPKDEIGQLATTFNEMLAQLEHAYVQVELALQAQSRFVADASHELRTPLTTLRGNLELLRRQSQLDGEERADILTDMIGETERLMRLVNALLTLARADTQQDLSTEPVALQPLLDEVCRQAQQLGGAQTIACEATGAVNVVGNADAIKQILLTLLDNAIKHTPAASNITVSSAVNGQRVAITVEDNGPGIEAAMQSHVFERFYRGDSMRTGPGAGLGLAIAKELTELQGGTLAVESRIGEGSIFTLSLARA